VVCGILAKVVQNNASSGLTDRLEVYLDNVRMLAGNKRAKINGRSLDVMGSIKKGILTENATVNCLVYARIIAMARVNGDPKYNHMGMAET